MIRVVHPGSEVFTQPRCRVQGSKRHRKANDPSYTKKVPVGSCVCVCLCGRMTQQEGGCGWRGAWARSPECPWTRSRSSQTSCSSRSSPSPRPPNYHPGNRHVRPGILVGQWIQTFKHSLFQKKIINNVSTYIWKFQKKISGNLNFFKNLRRHGDEGDRRLIWGGREAVSKFSKSLATKLYAKKDVQK